jgi:diguanylate cyclase (GGDEF)-like protein
VQRPTDRRSKGKKAETPRLTPSSAVSLSVTVSIGIGESQPKLSSDEIINQADKALYRAKRSGRNRIETGVPEKKVLGFGRKKSKDT